jgi:hypothetical protein
VAARIHSHGSASDNLRRCGYSQNLAPRDDSHRLELTLRLLDYRMLDLSGFETQLAATRSSLRSLHNSSSTRTSINQLPNELLSRIFLFGVKGDAEDSEGPWESDEEKAKRAAIPKLRKVLPALCRPWRMVALRLESSWSSVVISSEL